MRTLTLALALACAVACGPKTADVPPPPPAKIATTYKILSGVSMGGTGAVALGFSHPEKFDGIAVLGGPLDGAYFTRMIDRFMTGIFCSLVDLEAPGNGERPEQAQ